MPFECQSSRFFQFLTRLLVNGGPGQPRLSRTPMSMASMASSSDVEELAVLITEPPYESEPEIEPEPEPIRRRRKKKTYVYKPTHDIDDSALWDTDLELEGDSQTIVLPTIIKIIKARKPILGRSL